jgi:hypothetical protein
MYTLQLIGWQLNVYVLISSNTEGETMKRQLCASVEGSKWNCVRKNLGLVASAAQSASEQFGREGAA